MSTSSSADLEPLLESSGKSRRKKELRFFHPKLTFLPSEDLPRSLFARWRSYTRAVLSSKWGHYLVLLLVTVDVMCIFADFMIELHICGQREKHRQIHPGWEAARGGLDLASLVFSSLFMAELVAALMSFGLSYFSSKFHIFDSVVIVAAFVVDVTLHGIDQELGSIVVALRLWRAFKIIEELSSAGEERLEEYQEEIDALRQENEELKRRLSL